MGLLVMLLWLAGWYGLTGNVVIVSGNADMVSGFVG